MRLGRRGRSSTRVSPPFGPTHGLLCSISSRDSLLFRALSLLYFALHLPQALPPLERRLRHSLLARSAYAPIPQLRDRNRERLCGHSSCPVVGDQQSLNRPASGGLPSLTRAGAGELPGHDGAGPSLPDAVSPPLTGSSVDPDSRMDARVSPPKFHRPQPPSPKSPSSPSRGISSVTSCPSHVHPAGAHSRPQPARQPSFFIG